MGEGACCVSLYWCGAVRAAILGCCIVLLMRRVLHAAIPGWRKMSAAKLRGADGALFAYEGLVVGLSVRGFPFCPYFLAGA